MKMRVFVGARELRRDEFSSRRGRVVLVEAPAKGVPVTVVTRRPRRGFAVRSGRAGRRPG